MIPRTRREHPFARPDFTLPAEFSRKRRASPDEGQTDLPCASTVETAVLQLQHRKPLYKNNLARIREHASEHPGTFIRHR